MTSALQLLLLKGTVGCKRCRNLRKNDFSSSLFLNSVKIAEHFDTKIDKIGRNLRKLCLLENENLRNNVAFKAL